MQLFLIGPSGSGKDTQAKLIADKFNLFRISIGEMLRTRAEKTDDIGNHIKTMLASGALIEWNILEDVVTEQLQLHTKDFIWTGFPRLLTQAQEFDYLVRNVPHQLDYVINLNLSQKQSIERITHRKETDKNIRLDDQNDDAIQKRLRDYYFSIDDIRNYYNQTDRFIEIDASKSIDEVFESICDELENHFDFE